MFNREYNLLEVERKHRRIKTFLTILIMTAFISSFLIVFILPYQLNAKDYLTYSEYISRVYGGMNIPKTILFSTLNIVFFALAIFVTYRIYDTTVYNTRTRNCLLIGWLLLIFVWLLVFVLFMPQHALWGLYSYGDVKAPKEPERYIHFLGLGDIQEFGKSTYEKSKGSVKNIKRVIENFKYPDSLQGLITVGDCTQTGEDGRSFNPNFLADYESRFGLGTHDTIPVQVYECTGNHDWDCTEEIYPRMKSNYAKYENPTVKMIKRKNEYRYGITAKDDYGNYEWIWKTKNGKYNFIGIALNIGVKTKPLLDFGSTTDYLSGQPVNSIEFLKQRVQVHNSPNDRFFILTHYYDYPNPDDEKNIQECFGSKINQLKAMFIGHAHIPNLSRLYIPTRDNIFILPSPTQGYNVALFSYDTVDDRLLSFNISPDDFTDEMIQKFSPKNISIVPQAKLDSSVSGSVNTLKPFSQLNQSQLNSLISFIDVKNLVQRDGSLYEK